MTYFSDVTLQLVGGLESEISFKERLVNFHFSKQEFLFCVFVCLLSLIFQLCSYVLVSLLPDEVCLLLQILRMI